MNKEFKRYTVTAALPYSNGPVHIGHLAGVYVPADIYVRYLRLKKRDVLYICGSDEHGVPITLRAKKEGKTPQQVVDFYHEMNKKAFADFGISFDIYSRTSNKIHHETASDFFKKLYDKNDFLELETEQLYDEEANQFLADRYVTGTCPHCGYERAYGDQCEKCGTSLSATELINPVSSFSGSVPVVKATKHWYLPLDKYSDFIEDWIVKGHQDDWRQNVVQQVHSWIKMGLRPRAVTRDLDWGVPVPVENAEGKVLYVWFDAPIGYISATKELTDDWEKYWKDDETKLVHFIGKDNIVFHAIIFPIMLKAEGSYILPDNVPANSFLNLEDDKISTSRNWAVWLHEYLEDFEGKQDVLRYVLTVNAPESKDNNFTWKDFQTRNNKELVADFGNFVNRALVLTNKYFEGVVQVPGNYTDYDKEVLAEITKIRDKVADSLEQYRIREAQYFAMDLARLGNKYFAETEPWTIAKTDLERVKTILYIACQIVANLAVLMEPFLPFSAKKLRNSLSITEELTWDMIGRSDILKSGTKLQKTDLLFEQITDEMIEKQIERLEKIKKENELAEAKLTPLKTVATFDDFTKLDIRIGTVLKAEKVAKTKKLLKLTVDTGIDKRTIVAGIAEHYTPEQITGKKVTLLANLEPRKIKGILSEGMLLMAENSVGELSILTPNKDFENGSTVG
ncbi:MAG: methionine--tRNA ligase [Bacteroidales bacterium]|nr:methionine--tRNA ligase [Bacteroidales bacterium]